MITVRARGGTFSAFGMRMPKMDLRPGSFELRRAELLDGTSLLGYAPTPVEPPPDEGDDDDDEDALEEDEIPDPSDVGVTLLLPRPLADGETLDIRLEHVDTWPLARFAGGRSAGQTSGLQSFLPALAASPPGAPWPFRARVAVPADVEDFWIAESFSELFACMYVGAAFEPRVCDNTMDDYQKDWEQAANGPPRARASLTRAYMSASQPQIVYRYGPVLLQRSLIGEIGVPAFFGAIDVLLREHPRELVTTERLQAYLEQASGKDLSAFFAFWVHGGYVPRLRAAWEADGTKVSGTVTSDVPFGTLRVVVRVDSKDGPVHTVVEVVDGVGTFGAAARDRRGLAVTMDPERVLVLRDRSVRRGRPGSP